MNATLRAPSTGLIRVLLVDDDPEHYRLVADLLDSVSSVRFLMDRAKSLADGLGRIERARYDVCLLDLHLPDGDGLGLLSTISTRGLALPVVLLADAPTAEQDHRALTLGAAAFLDKSMLDPTTLDRTIRYAIHQRRIADGLSRQAFCDEPTGLISRMLYRDRLDRALAFARRRDREVAVMMIDLAFDPDQGLDECQVDTAVAMIGKRLLGALRETDSLARLDGTRLGVLIEGMRNLDHAAMVTRRTLRILRSPLDIEDQTISVTPSIGVAVYPREGGEGDTLMRQAEAAMRRAIAEGGGCCRFGSERIDYQAREGMVLDKAFGMAFEHRELRLRFHPEMHLNGQQAGLAGSIFWRHPDRGWLPMEGALVETDDDTLIKGMADWLLAAAGEQLLVWRRGGLKRLRLSLSFPFHRRPALSLLERAIEDQIKSRPVNPGQIELVLPEDLVLDDARRGCSELASLRSAGVRLALDDFGEGRAAVQDLRHDLLDGLKLAPALHRHLPGDERDEMLVRALINLGHDLDLKVAARGARDQRQFTFLKRLGCDSIELTDSFPPMSADAATTWLKAIVKNPIVIDSVRSDRSPEILVPEKRPLRRAPTKAQPPQSRD